MPPSDKTDKVNQHAPAFSGVEPILSWKKLTNKQIQQLTLWTSIAGDWSQLNTDHHFPFGYFQCQANKQTFFVKSLPADKASLAVAANKIVEHLNSQGINVNPLIKALAPKNTSNATNGQLFTLLIFDHLNARFSQLNERDNHLIVKNLARLHQALLSFPAKNQVQSKAEQQTLSLNSLWQQIRLGELTKTNALPEAVLPILHNAEADLLAILSIEAQVIHGDLNIGNILLEQEKVVFIDFENALETWASPIQDLAFFIERSVLLPNDYFNKNEALGIRAIGEMLTCYFSEIKQESLIDRIAQSPILLSKTLQAISLKCLLILANLSINKNTVIADSEWQKFIRHYQLASTHQPFITLAVKQWLNSH